MSRYSDLETAYLQYANESRDYWARGRQTVKSALELLSEYLELPSGSYTFAPVPEEREEGKLYSSLTAVTARDDGWWQGQLLVTLNAGATKAVLAMTIKGFTEEDSVVLSVGDSATRHHLAFEAETSAYVPILEEAFQRSITFLTSGTERFLEQTEQSGANPIGFVWED